MQIYILLGAPGAGKGTVAAQIAERTSAVHVSTGAMLREALKQETPAGLAAKAYMDQGALVPDPVLVEMIGELLATAEPGTVFLFDGFPRNESQAAQLDALLEGRDATVEGAICLEVPEAVIMDRLGGRRVCPSCGAGYHVRNIPPRQDGMCDACGSELVVRPDDNPETIANRLKVYEAQTAPLIAWYARSGKLRPVDGAGDVETTVDNVRAAMNG